MRTKTIVLTKVETIEFKSHIVVKLPDNITDDQAIQAAELEFSFVLPEYGSWEETNIIDGELTQIEFIDEEVGVPEWYFGHRDDGSVFVDKVENEKLRLIP
ncbi:hypothetical protein [Thalassoroseus pseudoceratinae]|uniref:hypothetical protein n=1 Tax=Thalassoroseus pseudoceratinae TaxID=2713176 RepID=UPI0014244FE2|nr:hypothetical protein [Thalassoroseus pseudoceratinae]